MESLEKIKLFFEFNNINPQSRLAVILFFLANAEEYGIITDFEFKKACSFFPSKNEVDLLNNLKIIENEIIENKIKMKELFRFAVIHLSFKKHNCSKKILICNFKSDFESFVRKNNYL